MNLTPMLANVEHIKMLSLYQEFWRHSLLCVKDDLKILEDNGKY